MRRASFKPRGLLSPALEPRAPAQPPRSFGQPAADGHPRNPGVPRQETPSLNLRAQGLQFEVTGLAGSLALAELVELLQGSPRAVTCFSDTFHAVVRFHRALDACVDTVSMVQKELTIPNASGVARSTCKTVANRPAHRKETSCQATGYPKGLE